MVARALPRISTMPDRLLNIGAKPDDPPELRRRKRLMVAFSMAVMPTGFVWGAIYYVLGETTAAAVPIAYMPFAAANLAAFARTRDLDQVRRGQCLLILSLPFVLHVALGGFEPSSGVVLWSVLAPFCALVFGGIGAGSCWLVVFSAIVGFAPFAHPRVTNSLPDEINSSLFLSNLSLFFVL